MWGACLQTTVPCLAAALTSLYITYNMPFIKPQQDRTDIHWKELVMIEEDGELVIMGEVPVQANGSLTGGEASALGQARVRLSAHPIFSRNFQILAWPSTT